MRYEGAVYRPPSEANSLIIQVTIGCSHNKCTFCSMYKDKKFRVREQDKILEDLREMREYYKHVKRIFLADGNALVLKTEVLKNILSNIKEIFPECDRVGVYSAPKDILGKSVNELKELHELGLDIAYLGIESGNDEVLKVINKGVTSQQMIKAGQRIVESGIKLSVMIISGLGGTSKWRDHAIDSAKVVSAINPQYVALLTLLINKSSEMSEKIEKGEMKLLSPKEIMLETKMFIENLELEHCVFRSNHASNYVALGGVLPQDKGILLTEINESLKENFDYKDEFMRRL
ncbi:radical SAM protein [Clostridiaceae bacterium M8S5]|nr:radical SAM protein [Clostridiaceae bacterium M8S5]